MKKLLTLMFTLALAVSLGMPVFAAGTSLGAGNSTGQMSGKKKSKKKTHHKKKKKSKSSTGSGM